MLFVTNRQPRQSYRTRINRKIDFDLGKNAPSNDLYYCRRNGAGDYTEIGSAALLEALRDSSCAQLLFYIHGFSNLPEPDIFPRVTRLQQLLDEKEQGLALVVPLIWPCDNDLGIVKDYWDDQKSADTSAQSFARLLNRFLDWRDEQDEEYPCLKRINILSHSMGNRVLRQALRAWNKYDLPDGVPLLFRNTFLVAADVVNETLEKGNPGELISHASRNVSVYFASDDLALRSSKVSNLKNKIASRRLGHTGPENINKVNSNVYAIDCDNYNTRYDSPKGHTYFLEDENGNSGKIFEHMFDSMKHGRVDVDDRKYRLKIL
ncbi:MAG: alpha/beta hydrolase [Gammaproteobacteria bacterium]